ncbi:unnamed protein product [Aphanomyces euteiches]
MKPAESERIEGSCALMSSNLTSPLVDSKRENATVSSNRAHKYTSLDKLKQLIAQIVQDYSALEKQLAPSGVAIHVILTQCMRTLDVGQIEDVVPTLLDVLSVMKMLPAFEDDVKLLLGLSRMHPGRMFLTC